MRLGIKPTRIYPPEFTGKAKADPGPHFRALVRYYVNPAAADALAKKLKNLPEGSVIVKEKRLHDWGDPDKVPVASGMGGMIKRDAGCDPEHGDWEYFYADTTFPLPIGRLKSGAECHAEVKAKDHVFRVRNLPQ